ncbi:hypothetical protein GE09DRAFT_1258551 [Coniochaeta sp. 2T2.1]|nr:hypothetical protein GE09DRAFT_1258551 [Coniochaeta sp. 2T2.1]
MHASIISLLAFVFTVLGGADSSQPEAHQCQSWSNNATTTVFHGCCRQVKLETYPTLALTALCPNREADYNTTAFPEGMYTFSRLNLDQCVRLHDGRLVPLMEDIFPESCDLSSFTLVEDPSQLQGTCGDAMVSYPLDSLIFSHLGILTCPGFVLGTPSASLDSSCCDIALDTANRNEPYPLANCQTSRIDPSHSQAECPPNTIATAEPAPELAYAESGFHEGHQNRRATDTVAGQGEVGYRATNVSLNECLAAQEKNMRGVMIGHVQGCELTLGTDGGVVLVAVCGEGRMGYNLSEVVRNEYGRLACY